MSRVTSRVVALSSNVERRNRLVSALYACEVCAAFVFVQDPHVRIVTVVTPLERARRCRILGRYPVELDGVQPWVWAVCPICVPVQEMLTTRPRDPASWFELIPQADAPLAANEHAIASALRVGGPEAAQAMLAELLAPVGLDVRHVRVPTWTT